jgi:hypothetical protein
MFPPSRVGPGTPDFPPSSRLRDYGDAAVAPHAPTPSDIYERLDLVARQVAYLDRRFDDANHRLELTEQAVAARGDDRADRAVGDLGARIEAVAARSYRLQVAALVVATLAQLAVLALLLATAGLLA